MKPMKNKSFNESGFTLIEVLIAMTLLIFGLMSFGVFSGNLIQKGTLLERKAIAATAAQDKIEEFKNLSLDALLVVGTTADPLDIESGTDYLDAVGGPATVSFKVFTRTWVFANSSAGVSEPLWITVTVTWEGPGASPYVVDTLLSQG